MTVAARVGHTPGWSVGFWGGQVCIEAPDVVDVHDPDGTFVGGIDLDLAIFGVPDEDLSVEDAAAVAIAAEITSCLHELAEWLRLDDVAVFATHLTVSAEWDGLAKIAVGATNTLVADHPAGSSPTRPATLTHNPRDLDEHPISAPQLAASDPFAVTSPAADLVGRVTAWPGVSISHTRNELCLVKDEMLADANDPTATVSGDLSLWAETFGLGVLDDIIDGRTAVRAVAIVLLADALHEITEWFRIDGARVFAPHPDPGDLGADDMASLDVCTDIATVAVDALFDMHPRPAYIAA